MYISKEEVNGPNTQKKANNTLTQHKKLKNAAAVTLPFYISPM